MEWETMRELDMAGGRTVYRPLLPEERVPKYKMDILSMGLCSALLPMYFCRKDGETGIFYRMGGLMTLEEAVGSWGGDMKKDLQCLSAVTDALEQADDLLLPPEDFPLTAAGIFLKEGPGGTRLFLLWSPERQRGSLCDRLADLLEEMESLQRAPQWTLCSLRLRRELAGRHPDLREWKRLLELELRRLEGEQSRTGGRENV